MSTIRDEHSTCPAAPDAPLWSALRRTAAHARPTPRAAATSAIRLQVDPRVDSARTRWALEQLLRTAGLAAHGQPGGATDLYYGGDSPAARAAAVWIPSAAGAAGGGMTAAQSAVIRVDGLPTPSGCCARGLAGANNRLAIDLAAATAFWLSLQGEGHAATRDRHGRVCAADSPPGRCDALARPPVHDYAQRLLNRLRAAGVRVDVRTRWPRGRRFAAALSHDVDLPERTSAAANVLRDWLSGRRGLRGAWWELAAAVRRRGAREALWAGPAARRAWDFAEFCAAESERGFRSAFYFAVIDRSAGHACDVSYRAAHARYRKLFAALAASGWEIGLHAAYLTAQRSPPALQQANHLAALVGRPIRGVRHHYLQLDRVEPLRSLADHLDAKLTYDSSIGFNDRPGFRAGTALPYQPFASEHGPLPGFVELPMTLADMHLPRHDEDAATRITIEHLEAARRVGGLAVLNWHVGNWSDAPGWRTAYLAALEWLAARSDAWVTTPAGAADWWLTGDETADAPVAAAE